MAWAGWAGLIIALVSAIATLLGAYFAFIPVRNQLHRRDARHSHLRQRSAQSSDEKDRYESPSQERQAPPEAYSNHRGKLVPFATFVPAVIGGLGLVAGLILLARACSPVQGQVSVQMPQSCAGGGPIVFIVSGRQDSPAPTFTPRMQAATAKAEEDGTPIGIVSLDGDPSLISVEIPNGSTAYQIYRFREVVASAVSSIRATSPHANVLGAIELAGETIHAACPQGGTIYLEDSGLQDVGPINFQTPGLLSAQPTAVVSFLARNDELPDLQGIDVVLAGIGDIAPPQQKLDGEQQQNLVGIWSAIVKAGGAEQVEIDPIPLSRLAPLKVPQVDLIPVSPEPQWSPAASPS